jgi:endo-1,4-beta-D-glucanase Y
MFLKVQTVSILKKETLWDYVSDVKNKDVRTEGMSYGMIFIKNYNYA